LPEPREALSNSSGRRAARRCTRTDDEVGGRQLGLGQPEGLANYATKSVAGDGISDGFRGDRQTESGMAETVWTYSHRQMGVVEAAPESVGRIEVRLP
jgi:hypothetical protein